MVLLCDAALAMNIVASALMNGVCCFHSMQEEENRKYEQTESLRKAIRVEWQRQQVLERDLQEQMLREKGFDSSSLLAEDRRRLLMETKRAAMSQNNSSSSNMRLEPTQNEYDGTQVLKVSLGRKVSTKSRDPSSVSGREMISPSSIQHRMRSAPAVGASKSYNGRVPLVVNRGLGEGGLPRAPSTISSLLDEDDDDGDDEFLEEVMLQ